MARVSKAPEERRAELIAAARYLFDKKGVAHTRVSDIVRQVGVAQGVFYYYFTSKAEIVDEVVHQVSEEVRAKADGILKSKGNFYKKLADIIELYIELVDQFLGDGETSLRGLNRTDAAATAPAFQGQIILENKLLELVQQGAGAGLVPIAYPAETALVLLQGIRRLAEEKLPGRRMIYTIAEQGLNLPANSLLRYLPK